MKVAPRLTAAAVTACVLLAQGCGGGDAVEDAEHDGSTHPSTQGGASDEVPSTQRAPWSDGDAGFVLDVVDDGSGGVKLAADPPDAKVMVVAAPDASLGVVTGPTPGSAAVAFPTWDQSETGHLIALAIDPDSIGAAFDPGPEDFQFGADVLVPDPPDDEGKVDNGDNLIQRGLYSSAAQLKLQVDHGVPSCRVAGTAGEAVVEAKKALEPHQWYRLRCQRSGGQVSLFAAVIDDAGNTSEWRSWVIDQATGDVDFSAADTPVAIAGKLSPQSTLVAASPDQFNGALAHVVYLSR